ncbi:MAG TPA: helix-turn-helix domain-containing protein [Acidimicrobiales bacterium]|nr:helix-turn-helix domain-containing protein [Acidimicrobiales bacterium]
MSGPDSTPAGLNLKQVARRLDVHYMTAYRYVRQGRLRAWQQGTTWRVSAEDVEAFAAGRRSESRAAPAPPGDRARRLAGRLTAGDEAGGWSVVEEALASGVAPESCCVDLVGGALAGIVGGDAPAATTPEHRIASAVAHRLVLRVGARFPPRGRPAGSVVVGAVRGGPRPLCLAVAVEALRLRRFVVLDLGVDVPPAPFVAAARRFDRLVAVVVGVGSARGRPGATEACRALHDQVPGTPVVVCGWKGGDVTGVGADRSATDGGALVATIGSLAPAGR